MPRKYRQLDNHANTGDNSKDDNEDKRKKAAYAVAGAVGGAAALKTKQVTKLYRQNASAINRAGDREYPQLKANDPKGAKKVTRGNKAAALRLAARGRSYTGTYTSKSGKMTGMRMTEGSGSSNISRYNRLTGGGLSRGSK